MELIPFPKFHDQFVTVPDEIVEASVNCDALFRQQLSAVKSATGSGKTVVVFEIVSAQPLSEVAINVTE